MSVYNRQNQEFVPLAETSGILQNMTSSNIEYVVCADGETPEFNTGIRLSPSKKLKFSQTVGVSYVRVVGNTTGDIIVTPNDEASSGGGSTTRIINHVQDWQPDTLYPTGTLVIYNNVLYKCVVPNHKTIFDPADWVVIGAGNDSGKGISVWNSQTNYKVDDIILHGNTLYVCVNEHVSSTEFGDDTEYWVVITDNAGTVLPDWQAREKYEKDEIVNVGGFIYRCKSPHISRDTFATMNDVVGDEDYWELISWVDWHTETQYLKDQIVYCDGALWRCLANHVSDNTSISNDSDKWIKICGYTLPVASVSKLGGMKVGNGLNITDDGTLSTDGEENIIEVVMVNNEPLPLIGKSVNIDLTDYVRSNDITAVLHYKGTKQDYNDLPIAGNIIGDVWNIVNSDTTHSVKAGDNVAWNGSTWDVLSGTVDLSGYVIKEIGKGLSTEDFTSVLKAKLEGIETGANAYTLPIATENILGGVKVGSNITINANGTISLTRDNITNALGYTPPEQDTDTTYPAVTYLENGLMLANDKKMLDYIVNTYWKPSTAYAVGATANHYALPPSYYLECTTAGTTGATAPVITPPVTEGYTINDGTVIWTVRRAVCENDYPKTSFGTAVVNHLLGSTLASLVSAVSTDSLFSKLLKKALEAAGLQYSMGTNGYICLGSLFGNLILQWGYGRIEANETSKTVNFPIAFTTTTYSCVACRVAAVRAIACTRRSYPNENDSFILETTSYAYTDHYGFIAIGV